MKWKINSEITTKMRIFKAQQTKSEIARKNVNKSNHFEF